MLLLLLDLWWYLESEASSGTNDSILYPFEAIMRGVSYLIYFSLISFHYYLYLFIHWMKIVIEISLIRKLDQGKERKKRKEKKETFCWKAWNLRYVTLAWRTVPSNKFNTLTIISIYWFIDLLIFSTFQNIIIKSIIMWPL